MPDQIRSKGSDLDSVTSPLTPRVAYELPCTTRAVPVRILVAVLPVPVSTGTGSCSTRRNGQNKPERMGRYAAR